MPELPEVETIRRGLSRRIVKKRIRRVVVRKKKLVKGPVPAFIKTFAGNSFTRIDRRGKLLIFHLRRGGYLLIHLKMTGQLIYEQDDKLIAGGHQWPSISDGLPNEYTHVQFDFADGSNLYFNDQRQFGFLQVVDENGLKKALQGYGVDPLVDDVRWEDFYALMYGRKTTLKAALLNQALVAGIGNIYADEICFAAKVKPGRRLHRISKVELRQVYDQISKVLDKALKYGGTTFRDFRDADGTRGNFTRLLKVYGREGQKCRRCRTGVVQKRVIAQRGTHWCSNCQL